MESKNEIFQIIVRHLGNEITKYNYISVRLINDAAVFCSSSYKSKSFKFEDDMLVHE